MQKCLHVLAWLAKAVALAILFIPELSDQTGMRIFAAASLFKDFLIGMGDVMDDGVKNGSFNPDRVIADRRQTKLPGIVTALALGLLVIGSGCMSEGYTKETFGADGKMTAREYYRERDLFKDTKSKGVKVGYTTPKGTTTAFSRGALDAQTDEAALDSFSGIVERAAEASVRGAIKGAKPLP